MVWYGMIRHVTGLHHMVQYAYGVVAVVTYGTVRKSTVKYFNVTVWHRLVRHDIAFVGMVSRCTANRYIAV